MSKLDLEIAPGRAEFTIPEGMRTVDIHVGGHRVTFYPETRIVIVEEKRPVIHYGGPSISFAAGGGGISGGGGGGAGSAGSPGGVGSWPPR